MLSVKNPLGRKRGEVTVDDVVAAASTSSTEKGSTR
jgi:hypothetical protein